MGETNQLNKEFENDSFDNGFNYQFDEKKHKKGGFFSGLGKFFKIITGIALIEKIFKPKRNNKLDYSYSIVEEFSTGVVPPKESEETEKAKIEPVPQSELNEAKKELEGENKPSEIESENLRRKQTAEKDIEKEIEDEIQREM